MEVSAYKAALNKLSQGISLHNGLKAVHDRLLKLDQFANQEITPLQAVHNWLDEVAPPTTRRRKRKLVGKPTEKNDQQIVRGHATYKKLLRKKSLAGEKPYYDTQPGKKNAAQYLLLIYKKLGVYLECRPGDGGLELVTDATGGFQTRGPDYDESVVYDVFYWRTTTDEIGIAKIRFYKNWQQAELVYHYRTAGKELAFLKGPVERYNENVYIDLTDKRMPGGPLPIRSFWSLFVSNDADKQDYIAGVFASSNRDNHEPICGKLLLKQNKENRNLDKSDFVDPPSPNGTERVLQKIPDDIFYVLTNTRLKVLAEPILNERTIPFHTEVMNLKAFAGTYQVYQPWRNAKLNLTRLTISENGQVVLTSNSNMQDTVGFVVYCGKTLIIRFAYDAEADYHRFYSMLERVPDSRNLTGIHAGLTEGKELVSGRVYLSRREPADEIQIRFIQKPSQSYFNSLYQTDPDAVKFLTNREPGSVDTRWMSHLDSLFNDRSILKSVPIPAYLTGSYNAFFLTKIEFDARRNNPDNRILLPEQPIQLIQMPLVINGDRVEIMNGGLTIKGEIYYDGIDGLMIGFRDSRFWSTMVLSIPKPGTNQASKNVYHYGTLARIEDEPEASALVLHREVDPARLTYRCFEDFNELMVIEHHYRGVVSFLFGDWGRFVRMKGVNKYTSDGFSTKYATFRRVFFAAACHHGSRNETTPCLDNLKRAFRHGFGLYQYARINSHHADFPQELLEERAMLRDALNEALSDETIKRYVSKFWKLSQYP